MKSNNSISVVKAGGQKEEYVREKLESSLFRAGASEEVVDEIVEHISEEIKDGMSTTQIYKHAFFLLQKESRVASVQYSLRRAIMELGPSGFPFEKFIAQILKEKGYEVLTDQMILGNCVQHEIDVVAWNENKLIMAEAKFHNEQGIKSDLKVALYVKARFDDIKQMKYLYGKERFVDEGWLITNTKFTSTAIHYAECNNLILIGWNYPKKGNLQDMIVDGDLHPITCLESLTGSQKHILLNKGIVLCKTIKEDTSVFHQLGINDEKAKIVLEEISSL
jgi:hypothetical protein